MEPDKILPEKHPGGRPTKYDPKFCDEIIEFFDSEPYEDVPLEHFDKDGSLKWVDKKRMANKLPTLIGFAKHIKVGTRTVYDWIDPTHASYHEEFSQAFTHAKELQKWFLIQNGLMGTYNPAFAIFTAINITDMKDKKEVEAQIHGKFSLTPDQAKRILEGTIGGDNTVSDIS